MTRWPTVATGLLIATLIGVLATGCLNDGGPSRSPTPPGPGKGDEQPGPRTELYTTVDLDAAPPAVAEWASNYTGVKVHVSREFGDRVYHLASLGPNPGGKGLAITGAEQDSKGITVHGVITGGGPPVLLWSMPRTGQPVTFDAGEHLYEVVNPHGLPDVPLTEDANIALVAPRAGDGVTSLLLVTGYGRTFEATVLLEVTDGRGQVLARTFTTAAAGNGDWGSFSQEIKLDSQPATVTGNVVAYEESAKDGSRMSVVTVPVVFQAALEDLARQILASLSAGDIAPLAGLVQDNSLELLVMGGGSEFSGMVEVNAGSLQPLVDWARSRSVDTVRQASVISNRHGGGYSIVTLELKDGYFHLGVTPTGHVTKVFATVEPIEWD